MKKESCSSKSSMMKHEKSEGKKIERKEYSSGTKTLMRVKKK